jgi:hypothetical protein
MSGYLKIAAIIAAGLAAFSGPGVNPAIQAWVVVAGTVFAAVTHAIDSVYNSPKGVAPGK